MREVFFCNIVEAGEHLGVSMLLGSRVGDTPFPPRGQVAAALEEGTGFLAQASLNAFGV